MSVASVAWPLIVCVYADNEVAANSRGPHHIANDCLAQARTHPVRFLGHESRSCIGQTFPYLVLATPSTLNCYGTMSSLTFNSLPAEQPSRDLDLALR